MQSPMNRLKDRGHMITCERYHDFSCGHRVVGHEGKCVGLHGHNYRIHFAAALSDVSDSGLDDIGRVVDFSVLKTTMCDWLERKWDHNMLLWEEDPMLEILRRATWAFPNDRAAHQLSASLVPVPFNPTAENMAIYLLNTVGPLLLAGSGVFLTSVRVEETRKCSATATLSVF